MSFMRGGSSSPHSPSAPVQIAHPSVFASVSSFICPQVLTFHSVSPPPPSRPPLSIIQRFIAFYPRFSRFLQLPGFPPGFALIIPDWLMFWIRCFLSDGGNTWLGVREAQLLERI